MGEKQEDSEIYCYSGQVFSQKRTYKEVGSTRVLVNGLVFRVQRTFSSFRPDQLFEGVDESKVFFDIGRNLVIQDLIFGRERFLPIPPGTIVCSTSATNCLGETYLSFVLRAGEEHSLCVYSETNRVLNQVPLAFGKGRTFKRMTMFSYCDHAFLLEEKGDLELVFLRESSPPGSQFYVKPLQLGGDRVLGLHAMHDNSSFIFLSTTTQFICAEVHNRQVRLQPRLAVMPCEQAGMLSKLGKFVCLSEGRLLMQGDESHDPQPLSTRQEPILRCAFSRDAVAVGYQSRFLTVIRLDKNLHEQVLHFQVQLPDYQNAERLQLSNSGESLFVVGRFAGRRGPRFQPFCVTLIFEQHKAYCLRDSLLRFPQFPVSEPVIDIVENPSLGQICLLTESSLVQMGEETLVAHKLMEGAVALTAHPVLPFFFVASRETYKSFFLASGAVKMTGYHENVGGITDIKFSPLGDKIAVATSNCVVIEKSFRPGERKPLSIAKTSRLAWVKNQYLLTLSQAGTVFVTDVTTMHRIRQLFKARCQQVFYDPDFDLLVGSGREVRLWDSEKEYSVEGLGFSAMLVVKELRHVFFGTEDGQIRSYPWPVVEQNFQKEEYTSVRLHGGAVKLLFISHQLNYLISVGKDSGIFRVKLDMLSKGTIRLEDQLINERKPVLKLFKHLAFNLHSVEAAQDDSLAAMKDKCRSIGNDLGEQIAKRRERLKEELDKINAGNKEVLAKLREEYRLRGDATLRRLLLANREIRLLEGEHQRERAHCQDKFEGEMAKNYGEKDKLDQQLLTLVKNYENERIEKAEEHQLQLRALHGEGSHKAQATGELSAQAAERMQETEAQFREFEVVLRDEAEMFRAEEMHKLEERLRSEQEQHKALFEQANNKNIEVRRLRTRKAVLQTLMEDLEDSIGKFRKENNEWADFEAQLAQEVESKEQEIQRFQDETRVYFKRNLELFKEKNALRAYYGEILENIQPLQGCLTRLELQFSENELQLARHHDRRIWLSQQLLSVRTHTREAEQRLVKSKFKKAVSDYSLQSLRIALTRVFYSKLEDWRTGLQKLVTREGHSVERSQERQRLFRSTCLKEAQWSRIRSLKKEQARVQNRQFLKVSAESAFFIRRTSELIEVNAKLKQRLKEIKDISLKEMGTHKFFQLVNQPTPSLAGASLRQLPFLAYKQQQLARSQSRPFGHTFSPRRLPPAGPPAQDSTASTIQHNLSLTTERIRPTLRKRTDRK